MNADRHIISNLCRQYGPILKAPEGMDGARLLWAISGNEGSFGDWFPPRHERSYCYIPTPGRYYDKELTRRWGCLAHMSYSPWQIMAPNAKGFSPLELSHPAVAIEAVVGFLNRMFERKIPPATLEEIADAYNSGNHLDQNVPHEYIARLKRNYEVPLL
ncbi:MAG: hypothetical protein L0387_24925 [Acidobacteria bacterium]|nr:hypothetical protein [Acidobacteriota bacterium]